MNQAFLEGATFSLSLFQMALHRPTDTASLFSAAYSAFCQIPSWKMEFRRYSAFTFSCLFLPLASDLLLFYSFFFLCFQRGLNRVFDSFCVNVLFSCCPLFFLSFFHVFVELIVIIELVSTFTSICSLDVIHSSLSFSITLTWSLLFFPRVIRKESTAVTVWEGLRAKQRFFSFEKSSQEQEKSEQVVYEKERERKLTYMTEYSVLSKLLLSVCFWEQRKEAGETSHAVFFFFPLLLPNMKKGKGKQCWSHRRHEPVYKEERNLFASFTYLFVACFVHEVHLCHNSFSFSSFSFCTVGNFSSLLGIHSILMWFHIESDPIQREKKREAGGGK